MPTRETIIKEVQRLAAEADGCPPGRAAFERATGIKYHEWYGVFWSRWGDAIAEAGLSPNKLQERFDKDAVLARIAEACRTLQKLPTDGDLRLHGRQTSGFPSHSTIANHFKNRSGLMNALRDWATQTSSSDILALLPAAAVEGPEPSARRTKAEGWVYLIQSGNHFKIGRSSEIERRIKEIKVALPEAANMVHAIATDDPAGIEAYWHRRFSERRANGEWFSLSAADVLAFKRRKFQ